MAAERARLLSALADLDRTMAETQLVLSDAGTTGGTFRDRISDGIAVAEAFPDMATPWAAVARQLDVLERARHEVRTAVFALGLAEGMSIGELGRLYGFSRQLAARVAREARQDESG